MSKEKDYEIQVKAHKPNKVVTIAKFSALEDAQEVRDQLTDIGFQVILHYPKGRLPKID